VRGREPLPEMGNGELVMREFAATPRECGADVLPVAERQRANGWVQELDRIA
jgi:hypothetical protein